MNEAGMDQTKPEKCPQCGNPLPAGALAGLCPACLLQQGVAADTATRPELKPFVPLTVEELARLFPQLEIISLLGKGGMGAVYKARQPALDRVVALKILPVQATPDPGFAERFTREARALARLSHPNIVAVHEFGQVSSAVASPASGVGVPPSAKGGTPALPYFIMEFVDGVNLRQLQKAGRLSPREALQIVPQICDALQYAHDEGVVHRDIKPENVLVDRKGKVKIADFGLAKILGCDPEALRLTGEGQVMGTPHYMAPEQVEHPLTVDHRADIFSLGVVFYEMLTGELPLGKFQPPSRKVQVDVRLDDVVLHALEKEPERRYQQVGEVKTAVEAISRTTQSAPSANPRSKPGAEAPAEINRKPLLSQMAMVGVCFGMLALVLFAFADIVDSSTPYELASMVLAALGALCLLTSTFLGWVAVSQIRRSAGQLYGLGLAFFDGMLFPLLALAGLLTWFWWWVYSDAVPRAILFDNRPLGSVHVISTFHAFILHHIGALTLLVAVVTSVTAGFFLTRWAWRKVNRPLTGGTGTSVPPAAPAAVPVAPAGNRGWKIAGLIIVAVVLLNAVIAVVALHPALHKPVESPAASAAAHHVSLEPAGRTQVEIVDAEGLGAKANPLEVVPMRGQMMSPTNANEQGGASGNLARERLRIEQKTNVSASPASLEIAAPLAATKELAESSSGRTATAEVRYVKHAPFIAEVTHGEIELVAISYHPSESQSWWQADGNRCTNTGFAIPTRYTPSNNGQGFEFVFQRRGLSQDTTLEYSFEPGASEMNSGGLMLHSGEVLPDHNLVVALLPESAKAVTIRLGVAAGKWKTLVARTPEVNMGGSFPLGHQTCRVLFLDPVESGGEARVGVSYNKVAGWTTRVTALDTRGKLHVSIPYGESDSDVASAEGRFPGLPLSQVKEFRFEARPYAWVEFRNVSLQPGQRTQVEIMDTGDK